MIESYSPPARKETSPTDDPSIMPSALPSKYGGFRSARVKGTWSFMIHNYLKKPFFSGKCRYKGRPYYCWGPSQIMGTNSLKWCRHHPFFLSPWRKGGAAFNGKYLLNTHVLFDHPCRDGPIRCFFQELFQFDVFSNLTILASSQHEQLWFAMIWHLSLIGYPNRNQFLSVLFFILAQHASRKLKVLNEICSCSPCEDRCKNGIVGKRCNHFKSETGINSHLNQQFFRRCTTHTSKHYYVGRRLSPLGSDVIWVVLKCQGRC